MIQHFNRSDRMRHTCLGDGGSRIPTSLLEWHSMIKIIGHQFFLGEASEMKVDLMICMLDLKDGAFLVPQFAIILSPLEGSKLAWNTDRRTMRYDIERPSDRYLVEFDCKFKSPNIKPLSDVANMDAFLLELDRIIPDAHSPRGALVTGNVDIVRQMVRDRILHVDEPLDGKTHTPLMLAARYGHLDLVRDLIALGATARKLRKDHLGRHTFGSTALEYAVVDSQLDIVKYFVDELGFSPRVDPYYLESTSQEVIDWLNKRRESDDPPSIGKLCHEMDGSHLS